MTATGVDDYLQTMRILWPHGDGPTLTRGAQRARDSTADFLVVPDAANPRLLVPAHNRAAAARAMLRFSTALGASEVAKRVMVAGLLRAGRLPLRDWVHVPSRHQSLPAYLSEVVFKQPVEVSLGLGTARANRKPVLQVFDQSGGSLAFVKLGTDAVSKRDVGLEEAALVRLGEASLPPGLQVPSLLHAGDWEDTRVLVLSSLKSRVSLRPAQPDDLPITAMRALHRAFGATPMALSDTPKWARLAGGASDISDSHLRERFAEAINSLSTTEGSRTVSVGAWHGDWTPWNMSRGRGRVQLWDWERFECGVPWGLDAYHFAVQTECRKQGMTVSAVLDGLRSIEMSPHLGCEENTASGGMYLAAITHRYLLSSQGLHGEKIADGSRTMLSALETWLNNHQRIS